MLFHVAETARVGKMEVCRSMAFWVSTTTPLDESLIMTENVTSKR